MLRSVILLHVSKFLLLNVVDAFLNLSLIKFGFQNVVLCFNETKISEIIRCFELIGGDVYNKL